MRKERPWQAGLREEAVKVLGFYPAQMEGPIASVGKNSVCYESGNCQYNGPGIIADAFKKSADFVKGLVTNENDLTSVEVAAQKVAEAQAALDLADAKNVATSWSNPVDKFRAAFDAAQKEKALSDAKAKYENALAAKKQTLANQEQDAQQDYRSQFSDLEPTTVGLNRSFLNQTRVDAENALQNAQDVINGKAASVVSPDTNRELRPVDNPIEKAYLDAQSNLDNARNNLRNAESKLSNVGNSNTSDVWAVQDARQAEIDAQKKFDEAKANYTKTFEQYQKQFNEPEPTTLPDKLEGFANSAKNINTEEGGVVTDIDLEKFNCPEGKNCQSKPTAIVGVCKIGGGDCKQIQMTPAQALKAKVGSKFVEPKNSFTPINIKSTLTDKVKDDPKNPGQKIPQAGSLNEEKVDPANKDVQLKPGEKIEFTDVF